MKRIITTALAALAAAGLAFGGGGAQSGKSGAGAAASSETIIKVAGWDLATSSLYGGLLSKFQDTHPNIVIDPIDIPSTDFTQKIITMLNGRSDVDAFWIKDGDTSVGMAQRGQLLDLTSYVQRDGLDLGAYAGLADRLKIDGKIIGLPASTGYYVLFYNTDLFDKAGVPYPSNDMTWDDFEALAKQMTSGSGADKVWGAHFHTWQALVQNWAVQDGKHTIVDTDYAFMKPYYEMVLRLQDAGAIQDYATLKSGSISYGNAFEKGNIAMLPMGTWFADTLVVDKEKGITSVNWGIATIPHPAGVPAGWTVGSLTPIAINQNAKNKDAAWEFIKWVTSEEGARFYASQRNYPSRSSASTLADIANAPGMPKGALDALQVKNIALDRPYAAFVNEVNQMLGEEHGLILLKEKTVDQGLADMAKRSKELQGK